MNTDKEVTYQDMVDVIDGLLSVFKNETKLYIMPFDKIYDAESCLKQIKQILEEYKPQIINKRKTCIYAEFDQDGCYCTKYKCMTNCVGNFEYCMKDYIS